MEGRSSRLQLCVLYSAFLDDSLDHPQGAHNQDDSRAAPMKYLVIYEHGESSWGAYVPDLPGVGVAGSTLDEVRQLVREAVEFHLEGLREHGDPIPQPSVQTEYITV